MKVLLFMIDFFTMPILLIIAIVGSVVGGIGKALRHSQSHATFGDFLATIGMAAAGFAVIWWFLMFVTGGWG